LTRFWCEIYKICKNYSTRGSFFTHKYRYNNNNHSHPLFTSNGGVTTINSSGDNVVVITHENVYNHRFHANGNVSFGTNDSSRRLTVNGDIKSGNIYCNGKVISSDDMTITTAFDFVSRDGQRVSLSSPSSHLHLYSLPSKNIYHWAPFQLVSDDRLKWEETPLTDSLDVIMRLKPVSYWRGQTIDVKPTEKERRWEIGLTAQKVEKIPQLKQRVNYNESTPDYPEQASYTLNYNDIHNYHLSATQELYEKYKN